MSKLKKTSNSTKNQEDLKGQYVPVSKYISKLIQLKNYFCMKHFFFKNVIISKTIPKISVSIVWQYVQRIFFYVSSSIFSKIIQ